MSSNTRFDDPNAEWSAKLIGKTVSDADHSDSNFCKKDLPEPHRIIQPNYPVTRDFRPERLNVFLEEGGKVERVAHH